MVKLRELLCLVDDDQMVDIYFRDRILWSGKKKEFTDLLLADCRISSINIENGKYARLEVYMSDKV